MNENNTDPAYQVTDHLLAVRRRPRGFVIESDRFPTPTSDAPFAYLVKRFFPSESWLSR